jgi:hypothetical protein
MSAVEAFGRALSAGGISGILAIIIALTICGRYFTYGAEDIPQILTYSFSTIIGFYFGAGSTAGRKASEDV